MLEEMMKNLMEETMYIQAFEQFANSNQYRWHYQYDGQKLDFQVQINGIIHGNESGSLPALIELIQQLENQTIQFPGRISIILGNPEAHNLDQRFVEEDLNRMFFDNPSQSHEACRARELMPIFDQCDFILDLHQTILPSEEPFYIFPNSQQSLYWAQIIGGSPFYIDATPTSDVIQYQCADEYVWRQGKPALTLELGEKGIRASTTETTTKVLHNLLQAIEDVFVNGADLQKLSASQVALRKLSTLHREPYHNEHYHLKDGLINFTPVRQGEPLQAPNTPELIAPCDGFLLFPKYPKYLHGKIAETLPKEIYRIVGTP